MRCSQWIHGGDDVATATIIAHKLMKSLAYMIPNLIRLESGRSACVGFNGFEHTARFE